MKNFYLILNTTETSTVDKEVTCEKNNFLICIDSLIIMCLLSLVIVSICCYYLYTEHWIKKGIRIAMLI